CTISWRAAFVAVTRSDSTVEFWAMARLLIAAVNADCAAALRAAVVLVLGVDDRSWSASLVSTEASRSSSRWIASAGLWKLATIASSASIRLTAIAALSVALTPRRNRPMLSMSAGARLIGMARPAGELLNAGES